MDKEKPAVLDKEEGMFESIEHAMTIPLLKIRMGAEDLLDRICSENEKRINFPIREMQLRFEILKKAVASAEYRLNRIEIEIENQKQKELRQHESSPVGNTA
jgi:hypothetical protein